MNNKEYRIDRLVYFKQQLEIVRGQQKRTVEQLKGCGGIDERQKLTELFNICAKRISYLKDAIQIFSEGVETDDGSRAGQA